MVLLAYETVWRYFKLHFCSNFGQSRTPGSNERHHAFRALNVKATFIILLKRPFHVHACCTSAQLIFVFNFLQGNCTAALDVCGECGGTEQSGMTCPEVIPLAKSVLVSLETNVDALCIAHNIETLVLTQKTDPIPFVASIGSHSNACGNCQKFYSEPQTSKKLSPPSSCKSTKTSSPYRSKGCTCHHKKMELI